MVPEQVRNNGLASFGIKIAKKMNESNLSVYAVVRAHSK